MAENKTRPTQASVTEFLDGVSNQTRRQDSYQILEMMQEITGEPAVMWGGSLVGFGEYHYKYASGREGDMFLTGFSPRVQSLTLYIMDGFDEYDELLGRLGKYKLGKSCLYINKLADVDMEVLQELVRKSAAHVKNTHP